MHQHFGRYVTASLVWQKYVQKSGNWQEMALLMFGLLDCSPTVKYITVGSRDKQQPAWQALRNLDFYLQKVLRFMALDVTLWKFLVTPLEERN